MSVKYTTLWAMNEFTNSVSSSVNCLLLENGDQVVRGFVPQSESWRRIRIGWKQCIVGTNPTESISSIRTFAGVCTTSGGIKTTASAVCYGVSVVNDPDSQPTTAAPTVSRTRLGANPSGSTVGFSSYAAFPQTIVTGSASGSSGIGNVWFPRYEAAWSGSEFPSASFAGFAWCPVVVEIIKSSSLIWQTKFVYYPVFTTLNATESLIRGCFNIPAGIFRNVVQSDRFSATLPQQWDRWFVEITGSRFDSFAPESDTTPLRGINESAFGRVNNVNFYFSSSNPHAKLAIRDVMVVVMQ